MTIPRLLKISLTAASIIFFISSASFAEVNDGNHGFHLRAGLGAGNVYWGYLNQGGNTGDLGEGNSAAALYLSLMYNYKLLGLEASLMSGNISDLEWKDEDTLGTEYTYKSTGSGNYSTLDLKLGLKLFTEPGDMGYTFIYGGLHSWSTERTQDSIEYNSIKLTANKKYKGNGSGWIIGFRDFSTIGWDAGLAIVIQSGLYGGKAPADKFTEDGNKVTYSVKQAYTLGGELAAGIAFQNIGLSIVGGVRGHADISVYDDSAASGEDESVFGFGNAMFFIEAGLMF